MQITVTGGLGFIGSHLCDALQAAGHRLTVLDDVSTGRREHLPPGARLIESDVADADAVAQAMEGAEACYHLAAIASVERCRNERGRAHAVNFTGTARVMDAAARQGIPVVYASSAAVYGNALTPPVDESMHTAPASFYGQDKLEGERYGQALTAKPGLRHASLRFFNVYGPRQDPLSPYSGVISIFMRRMLEGRPVTLFGDGGQTRDFIAVGDIVAAMQRAMEALLAGELAHGVFNVCTGHSTSINRLAEVLAEQTRYKGTVSHAPARADDIRHSCGNPALLQRMLGFAAATKLEEGLSAALAWMRGRQ